MKKTCSKCKISKEIHTDFSKNKSRSDGLNSWCRKCAKVYAQKYYQDNKTKLIKQIGRLKHQRRKKLQEKMYDYLSNQSCVDCGNNDVRVLEFDHIKNKNHSISEMLHGGFSWRNILVEIAKCEVRCANCHRIKTYNEGISWRTHFYNI